MNKEADYRGKTGEQIVARWGVYYTNDQELLDNSLQDPPYPQWHNIFLGEGKPRE